MGIVLKVGYIQMCLPMCLCYLDNTLQGFLGRFPSLAGNCGNREIPGIRDFPSREIPVREVTGIPEPRELPVSREFPESREIPVREFTGIPENRELPLVREFPGREKFEGSREGGNGNFPLNIPALLANVLLADKSCRNSAEYLA